MPASRYIFGAPAGADRCSTNRRADSSSANAAALLVALAAHAVSLRMAIFDGDSMRFGFAIALSVMLWLAIALYWIESFYARMDGLQVIGLPAAAVAAMLPALFSEAHVLANAGSMAFRLHFLMAMLAYSLFTLAALHALLMATAEKGLHRGRISPLLAGPCRHC
jgi:ABC-type uncharacterized transport system permease subunit